MKPTLKPISEQVMVITGASSGIGLVTAKMAARRGAQVVLAARNAHDLKQAVDSIRAGGGRADYFVVDVADPQAVRALADFAIQQCGRIDSWVNNAAVAMYGRIVELSLEDMRRQFDVNYWGAVHGTLAAIPYMREEGGALINVASALADRAIPLQGNYCAAKHALKAFTDALRMELEEEGAPVSVTLVKPASISTPLFDKARSLMGVEPKPIAPVYAPEVAARTIIGCAQRPVRHVTVGGNGRVISIAAALPRATDRFMERTMFDAQRSDRPLDNGRKDNLYEPVADDGGERSHLWEGRVIRRSAYTAATMNPGRTALTAAMVALAIFAGRKLRDGGRNSGRET
jgi:short-subunit dehydrogenase